MQFYLDSANLDEIEYARKHWNISGVTTNPRIIMSTGKSFQNVLSELADIVKDNSNFPVFVQINPYLKTATEMMEAAKKLISFSPNFVIKIPCTEQGNVAAYHLEQEGIRTALTLVFSAAQSIQAGRAGISFIAPYVAWKEEISEDAYTTVREIINICNNYNFATKTIVAAIKNSRQIVQAALAGSSIVTTGFHVYKSLFDHPFTDRGLALFQSCWDATDTEIVEL